MTFPLKYLKINTRASSLKTQCQGCSMGSTHSTFRDHLLHSGIVFMPEKVTKRQWVCKMLVSGRWDNTKGVGFGKTMIQRVWFFPGIFVEILLNLYHAT